MRLISHLSVLALWVGSVFSPAQAVAGEKPVYCGGETGVSMIDRFFSDLREELSRSRSTKGFNAFVARRFSVRSGDGTTRYFNVKEVGAVTPGKISIQDWREISRRGSRSLHSAGWRGCYLSAGKVWFEGTKENGFRLKGIARDMPWTQPENGDDVPNSR